MDTIEIIKELAETTSLAKNNAHQIEEIKREVKTVQEDTKAIYKIATSIEVMANNLAQMKCDIADVKDGQKELAKEVTSVKSDLLNIKNQDVVVKGKKWDGFWTKLAFESVKYIAIFLIGGILAYIFVAK